MSEWIRKRFEFGRGGHAHNIRTMEGLRGFAVLMVFLVHYEALVRPWIAKDPSLLVFASSVQTIGGCGVDLFFLLSGYLIYGSLLTRQQPFREFFARRLRRIYPAFTAVFAVYVGLSILLPSENRIPADHPWLFLLVNYLLVPGLFPSKPMITVAWSLSYEMFCYLALPVMVTLLKLRDLAFSTRLVLFLSIASVFSIYTAVNGGPIRLIMFVAGIVLYETINN